jgi:Uma2 family endonuclease
MTSFSKELTQAATGIGTNQKQWSSQERGQQGKGAYHASPKTRRSGKCSRSVSRLRLLLDRHVAQVADLGGVDAGIRIRPDVLVALGRPKGERRSYRQWEEDNVAPQVVFEVLSPGNRPGEMDEKFQFYQRYGVDEY